MIDSLLIGVLIVLCFLTFSVSAYYFSLVNLPDPGGDEKKELSDRQRKIRMRVKKDHENTEGCRRILLLVCLLNSFLIESILLSLSGILSGERGGEILFSFLLLLLATILYLLLFIYFPYYVFSVRSKAGIYAFQGVFFFCKILLFPIYGLASLFARILSRPFRGKNASDPDEVTEEEILSMVNEGNESGSILSSEATMVQNIFELDDKCVKDIMVHRNDITAMEGNTSLKDAIHFFQDVHFSRIPVYLDSLDNIIGIVHIKDILQYSLKEDCFRQKIRDMDDLLRPAKTVPETHGIYTLFTTMQLEKTHMAIVIDEYGQTSGLVSMEDILEEIVGNIQDEHDEEESKVEVVNEQKYKMDGMTPMDEVSQILDTDLTDPENEIDTLNGFLINEIHRVPMDHETFTVKTHGFAFHVKDVKDHVIREVLVEPIPEESDSLES